jgi:hypothetical protein
MAQNPDPFDEFRMKKVISNLESGFRHCATRKRKRLKELLEEDDGGDPDGVEVRVQEEMESFFTESANAAESVFAEIGQGGEAETAEIQERLDAVLRPVEAASVARREPTESDTDQDEDADRTPGADDIRNALARLGGGLERPDDNSPTTSDSESLPDWLDATEERVDEQGRMSATEEDDQERQRRILGAFDTSFDRLRSLIRDGLTETEAEAEIELEHEVEAERGRDEDGRDDPPLTRRTGAEGFEDRTQRAYEQESAPELTATATADPVSTADLTARVEAVEKQVARLRRILLINGLTDLETP